MLNKFKILNTNNNKYVETSLYKKDTINKDKSTNVILLLSKEIFLTDTNNEIITLLNSKKIDVTLINISYQNLDPDYFKKDIINYINKLIKNKISNYYILLLDNNYEYIFNINYKFVLFNTTNYYNFNNILYYYDNSFKYDIYKDDILTEHKKNNALIEYYTKGDNTLFSIINYFLYYLSSDL